MERMNTTTSPNLLKLLSKILDFVFKILDKISEMKFDPHQKFYEIIYRHKKASVKGGVWKGIKITLWRYQ